MTSQKTAAKETKYHAARFNSARGLKIIFILMLILSGKKTKSKFGLSWSVLLWTTSTPR